MIFVLEDNLIIGQHIVHALASAGYNTYPEVLANAEIKLALFHYDFQCLIINQSSLRKIEHHTAIELQPYRHKIIQLTHDGDSRYHAIDKPFLFVEINQFVSQIVGFS